MNHKTKVDSNDSNEQSNIGISPSFVVALVVIIRVVITLAVWLVVFVGMFAGYFTIPVIMVGLTILIYSAVDFGIYLYLRRREEQIQH
jgi:hypothetical protein